MRRYHHSLPSIPFHIAHYGVCEPVGSPVDGLEGFSGTSGASDTQRPLDGPKTASRVFVVSMWVAGVAIGAGLALELNGVDPIGLFVQASGFLFAVVSVYRHPEE